MRSKIVKLVVFYCAMSTAVMAAKQPFITMQTIGDVPQDLAKRISLWLTENIGSTTNVVCLESNAQTLKEAVKSVKSPAKNCVVLILVNRLPGESQYFFLTNGVVALNLDSMRPADMSTDAAKEIFARRVEAKSVGGVAAALGLPSCPMIRCALYHAHAAADFDAMSRNLCPPCTKKLEERLKKLQGHP